MEKNNPFKKLGQPPKEVPKEVKTLVMQDVAALKFAMETASLFFSNYGKTMGSFFEKRKDRKNTKLL